MKIKNLNPLLLLIIVFQSALLLLSFNSSNDTNDEETVQSYKIERRYYDGRYFYVLISGGEAKAFL